MPEVVRGGGVGGCVGLQNLWQTFFLSNNRPVKVLHFLCMIKLYFLNITKVGLKGEIDLKNSKTFYKFAVEIFSIPHDNTLI
jgi:hypothetical protein